jgi:hypothetical protein
MATVYIPISGVKSLMSSLANILKFVTFESYNHSTNTQMKVPRRSFIKSGCYQRVLVVGNQAIANKIHTE